MQKLKWKTGASPEWPGPYLVSATRVTYRRMRYMPGVFWYGHTLRSMWPTFVGSVGVSLAADFSKRTTYTLSAWCSPEALRAFVAHPDHLALIKSHQPRVESSAAVTWTAERLQLRELWALAHEKLAGIPSHG